MSLIEMKLQEFVQEVDAATPAPGGGSVAALAVAQGIALFRMVGQLTMAKKKFQTLTSDQQSDFRKRLEELLLLENKAFDLIEQDTEAFNNILKAVRLPKESPEEEAKRNMAINETTITATEVPMETAKVALQSLELAAPLFPLIIKSAVSDMGVGALMAHSGMLGAEMNVKINASGLDEATKNAYFQLIEALVRRGTAYKDEIIQKVNREFH
ncbi:MAG: cyclodeaminase/cyclohydrolase family protein [Acholeplasmataceae bacterium]|nr:cyclodeaminase/cyclohydrolase family protein [Acholeplasmataceae bacterium]